MSIKAIGILADKVVPFGIIKSMTKKFPQHHIFLINNSFHKINEMHQYNLDSMDHLK